ncbi:MAG: NUDIX domain-containing protein [Proteobacteria bacterium]|nr:NUDIX domain-containing protein [Pseudomonadota bacterium]
MIIDGHFLTSRTPLGASDAAAAIIVTEDGRYLLQLRDDIPPIWYPGHWGLFGGAVDPGEDEIQALRRELREELELHSAEPIRFVGFDFDLKPTGLQRYFRNYYEVRVSNAVLDRLVLHEGTEMRTFTGDEALSLPRLVPYDAFALFLHHQRARLG